jgi:hypothetical protein
LSNEKKKKKKKTKKRLIFPFLGNSPRSPLSRSYQYRSKNFAGKKKRIKERLSWIQFTLVVAQFIICLHHFFIVNVFVYLFIFLKKKDEINI